MCIHKYSFHDAKVCRQCEVYFDKLISISTIVTFMTSTAHPQDWINVISVAIYNDNGTFEWITDSPPFYPENPNDAIPV